jgi:hypothetical protein
MDTSLTGAIVISRNGREFYFGVSTTKIFSRLRLFTKQSLNSSKYAWKLEFVEVSKTPSSLPSMLPSLNPMLLWQQLGDDIDAEATYDQSGFSVSLSSDGYIVAVGAQRNDGNGTNSGHVRIFQWIESSSEWRKMGRDIDGERYDDSSGQSVSLSSDGSIVAVGAPFYYGNVCLRRTGRN